MTLVMTSLPLARAFMWFSMFVYIILCLFMLHADWQKSDSSVDGESQLQALLPFPAPLPERPRKS